MTWNNLLKRLFNVENVKKLFLIWNEINENVWALFTVYKKEETANFQKRNDNYIAGVFASSTQKIVYKSKIQTLNYFRTKKLCSKEIMIFFTFFAKNLQEMIDKCLN